MNQYQILNRGKACNTLNEGKVFKKEGNVIWRCRNCGFIHEAKEAPGMCPACAHPQAYFEVIGEND